MENVAEKNLKDLIERNLILVGQLKYNGKPRTCKMHDLVRDLCIKEARKEKFLFVSNDYIDMNPKEVQGQRRVSIHFQRSVTEENVIEDKLNVIQSMPGNRSVIYNVKPRFKFGSELLRVLLITPDGCIKEINELINLRMVVVDDGYDTTIPFSISKLWNLQYLVLSEFDLPSDIWNMPQLRCEEEVLVRIPNLRKLKIGYSGDDITDWSYYHLQNLVNLSKLETLCCKFHVNCNETLVTNLAFPVSLKKLTLSGCRISWEYMKILGVLPNLEILNLQYQAFEGPTWETVEDNFKKLEYLMIWYHDSLNEWRVDDANHFPSLRLLFLQGCKNLEEIPSSIGEIPTLEIIEVNNCSDGAVSSAQNIEDSNDDIKLYIYRSI